MLGSKTPAPRLPKELESGLAPQPVHQPRRTEERPSAAKDFVLLSRQLAPVCVGAARAAAIKPRTPGWGRWATETAPIPGGQHRRWSLQAYSGARQEGTQTTLVGPKSTHVLVKDAGQKQTRGRRPREDGGPGWAMQPGAQGRQAAQRPEEVGRAPEPLQGAQPRTP